MEPDGGNTCGIGIELCVAEDNDYAETLKNGALLAGYLLWKYDLGMEGLKKHQDFSGKICPARLINEIAGMNFAKWWRKIITILSKMAKKIKYFKEVAFSC